MKSLLALLLPLFALLFSGCQTAMPPYPAQFSHFKPIRDFSGFVRSRSDNGQTVLLSPAIDAGIFWNQLVVSWNAEAPPRSFVKIEAAAISPDGRTRFYVLAQWAPDATVFPRASVPRQRDPDGTVATDTLVLNHPASAVQIRVTLGGASSASPTLKFLGLSFANTQTPPASHPPNREAWSKLIPTPELSQYGYAGANGWCSPASLAMVLDRWAGILHRPDLNLTVPQVAAAVYDPTYDGTGNWAFNTAFAGSFAGMRAEVARFDDLSEVEDWIASGIPVILSARWDLLDPGRPADTAGHLIVCVGFTENGDVIVNEPAARLDRGQSMRRVYRRADVARAWAESHNTVYLVYPEGWNPPRSPYGHW